jgi:hypothetical protein
MSCDIPPLEVRLQAQAYAKNQENLARLRQETYRDRNDPEIAVCLGVCVIFMGICFTISGVVQVVTNPSRISRVAECYKVREQLAALKLTSPPNIITLRPWGTSTPEPRISVYQDGKRATWDLVVILNDEVLLSQYAPYAERQIFTSDETVGLIQRDAVDNILRIEWSNTVVWIVAQ